MEDSIYNKVFNRRKQLSKILNTIIQCNKDELLLCDFPEIDNIDENEICFEIDQFVKESPKTYEKYLPDLLKMYSKMQVSKNKYISEFLPEKDERIFDFFWTIDYIVDHLQYILKIERQRFIDIIDRLNPETTKKTVKPQPGRKRKELKSYEDLYSDTDNAKRVKDIFEKNGYTKNFKWVKDPNRSNNDSELLAAFYVLRPLFVNHDKTPAAKYFYKEFGVDPLSDKMMSIEPFNDDKERFEKLFSDLLKNK